MKTYLPIRPPFYDDVEQDYHANLIYTLAWSWVIGITLVSGVEILIVPAYWLREVLVFGSISAISLIGLLLNKYRHKRLASVVLPVGLWCIVTTLALTSGGIYAISIVAYLPIIITSGFLLGGISGIIMAVLCGLSTLAFVLLDIYGGLPAKWVIHTPVTTWICYLLSCMQVTIMQFWAVGRIRKSFQSIAVETDERKLAEARLRESEFNYRMVVQNKIIAVAWVTPEGRLINGSETMKAMLGYTLEEMQGKFFGDFTHPDDLPREMELFEKIKRKEIDSYLIEKRFRHKNGNYLWIELNRTAYYNPATGDIDFFISIVQNIHERKLAQEELRLSNEHLQKLSGYLQTVREEERTSIAREIHDELGQQLTGLKMDASALTKQIPAGNTAAIEKIAGILTLIDDTINSVNKISSDLRPSLLDNLGLEAALEWQSSEFEKRTGVHSTLRIESHDCEIDRDISTCVFRIYQEALTNIIRHARATEVDTYLDICERSVVLVIKDNGVGFDMAARKDKPTFGLTGMEERARMFNGEMKVESEPGKGTTITVCIPFTQPTETKAA